ncbi:MAG TPA: FecR domain-containing protein, partial [Spirochaetota bacterium]|nr:FecR domain-containing protein [Spirochaetota bacterium]
MKFFNKEIMPPVVLGVAAIVFALLLYHDMSASIDASGEKRIGEIQFASRTAQRKYANQVIWERVNSNTPVFNGDSIRTADLSEAVIKLRDGTEISLHENSMVLLSVTERKMAVDFTRGSMTARKRKEDGSFQLAITAGALNVAVDESHLMMKKEENEEVDVTVREGEARLLSEGEDDVVLSSNQKAEFRPGSSGARVTTLPVTLVAPEPGTFIAGRGSVQPVRFTWEYNQPVGDAMLEIAGDRNFKDIITRSNVTGTSTVKRLKEGGYYWRISSVKKDTASSDWSKFTVLKIEPLELVRPVDSGTITAAGETQLVRFSWKPHRHMNSYELRVARDPEMEEIIIRKNSIVTDTAVDIPADKGTYYWSVRGEAALQGLKEYSINSKVYSFTMASFTPGSSVQLIRPEGDERVIRDAVNWQAIPFSWKKMKGVDKYELQVADNPSFSGEVWKNRTANNVLLMEKPLKPGKYYWQVAPVIENNVDSELFSERRTFSVDREYDIGLIKPSESAEISIPPGKTDVPVTFSWRGYGSDFRHKLEISAGYDYKNIYDSRMVSASSVTIPSLEAGEYFWRITLINPDGDDVARSVPRLMKIRGNLYSPVVLTPRTGDIVNLKSSNSFTMAWESVDGADEYVVSLFSVDGTKRKKVKEYRTKSTSIKMDQLHLLDEGRFEWTVKALDTARDDNSVVLRESGEE